MAERRRGRQSGLPELDAYLEAGRKERQNKISLGRLGRRARLREEMIAMYGEIPTAAPIAAEDVPEKIAKARIPKPVRLAAEGLMDEPTLKVWWASPNDWLWPVIDNDSYYDKQGVQRVSPRLIWRLGQRDDVIDLLMALKGDPYEQVIESLERSDPKSS